MEYYLLSMFSNEENGAIIESLPKDGPSEWEYLEGISLIKRFPKKAILKFSQNYPDFREVHDFLKNILRVLIVSPKVVGLINSAGENKYEKLPVQIYNHRDELVSNEYVVLNFLKHQNIIDMKKSDYKMASIEKDQVKRIKKLVVDHENVDKDAIIFRASTMKKHIFIREDLLEIFKENDVTGYKVYQANGWNGVDI